MQADACPQFCPSADDETRHLTTHDEHNSMRSVAFTALPDSRRTMVNSADEVF
jgi:hypothetical protein